MILFNVLEMRNGDQILQETSRGDQKKRKKRSNKKRVVRGEGGGLFVHPLETESLIENEDTVDEKEKGSEVIERGSQGERRNLHLGKNPKHL